MILQALTKRFEDTGGVSLGWQIRPVDYAVDLDEDGNVLNIVSLFQHKGSKKIRRELLLPEEPPGRTSGIKAAFLCDKSGYLFGQVTVDEKTKLEAKLEKASQITGISAEEKEAEFREKLMGLQQRVSDKFFASKQEHLEVLESVSSHAAIAVKKYFLKTSPSDNLSEQGNYVFMLNGSFVNEDEAIIEAWNSQRKTHAAEETTRCLVTGRMGAIAKLHGKIALPGVSMGAVPLISINEESFASYGKTASDPAAQICEETSFFYATALNELLKSDKHRQRLGIDTIVYWAEDGGEAEAEIFSWSLQPTEGDADKLGGIMSAFTQGRMIEAEGCDMSRPFHIMGLSPNAGRISIRFFISDSFGGILKNILDHYRDLAIISPKNDKFPYLPPWVLLSETTVAKKAGDSAPLLSGQLLSSIIEGTKYPATLYYAILIRAKAGEPINKTKAAIIKAVLTRNYCEGEVNTVSLNPDSNNKPYVLGRLFSALEQLQQRAAGGSLNSTIRDRYFSSACSNPGSVFPTLLSLSMKHAAKLDNAVFYERLKTDLIGRLDEETPFPAALSLDDQGRFIIGYYHQTQDFFTSKKDRKNKEDNNA